MTVNKLLLPVRALSFILRFLVLTLIVAYLEGNRGI